MVSKPLLRSFVKAYEAQQITHTHTHGEFRKSRGTSGLGVLILRILLFRVLYEGPHFRKLPH